MLWLCYENPWPETPETPETPILEFLGIPFVEDYKELNPYRGMLDVTVCTAVVYGEIPHKKWPMRQATRPRIERGV